ncbi:MAG TPA: GNAT family N-acetyltransferase [Amycolatopsis sp.]|nr:GNAT family N-acetyltransferase [Amycolatopsis sp.]HKS45547.1 GNAT family N-acetyltransferase [Amycolatopsis sp.]
MKYLRPASSSDLAQIGEIYTHYVTTGTATFELTPPDEAEWMRRFASVMDADLPFLVAELDGRVAGYAYCTRWKSRPAYRQTVEDSVYLAPWAAGRSIGGTLLDELLVRCAGAGVREVIAVIAATGTHAASLALHRGRGFVDAGVLTSVGFKHGQWLDTHLLQRSLR